MIDFKRKYETDRAEDSRAMQFLVGLFAAWFAVVLAFAVFHSADASAGPYLELAAGYHLKPAELGQSDIEASDPLGKIAAGYRLNHPIGLFVEFEHISSMPDMDKGLNTLWGGVRFEFR